VFVELLANADQFNVVAGLSSHFADCIEVSPSALSLSLRQCMGEQLGGWQPHSLARAAEGLGGILLALKRKPVIRFCRGSSMAAALANELHSLVCDKHVSLFDVRRQDVQPVLLICDRRMDMASCLLTQWTMQAMLHELSRDGIHNNRIKFAAKDEAVREMALHVDQDEFYANNLYSSYGVWIENAKAFVAKVEQYVRGKHQIDPSSIVDMKRFIQEYPQFRLQAELSNKHVTLIEGIERVVLKEGLMAKGEVEQEMVAQTDTTAALQMLDRALSGPLSPDTRLRLALIFTGHFSGRQGFSQVSLLEVARKHLDASSVALVEFAVSFAAPDKGPAFGSPAAPLPSPPVDDSDYTRHVSPLVHVVDRLLKGRLSSSDFPLIQTLKLSPAAAATDRPTDVILFVVNGGAFQEQCQVQRHVQTHFPNVKVVYGCTDFLNSRTFIEELGRVRHCCANKSGDE
jgi:hypothetical protein